MSYPIPTALRWPLPEYTQADYRRFGQWIRYKKILWMRHLGDDLQAAIDTPVQAVGEGTVVYVATHPGTKQQRSWGGLVIIGHQHKTTNHSFYSLYGHLYQLKVQVGQTVTSGQIIGHIAPGSSPHNGGWTIPHLHFALYTGPWQGRVLPGYWRLTQWWRTRLTWWQNPKTFIEQYTQPLDTKRYG